MSHRVTIPDGHVALVVTVQHAQELERYARMQREHLKKRKWAENKPILGILADLQLAASDALAYPLPEGM